MLSNVLCSNTVSFLSRGGVYTRIERRKRKYVRGEGGRELARGNFVNLSFCYHIVLYHILLGCTLLSYLLYCIKLIIIFIVYCTREDGNAR